MLKEQVKFYACGRINRDSAKLLASMGLKWCTGHKDIVPIAEFYTPRKSSLCKKCDSKKVVNSKCPSRMNYNDFYKKSPEAVQMLITGEGNGRYSHNKSHAKHLGRAWTLTKEEYNKLLQKPCTYCHLPIGKWGYGLDRLDNSRGYELDNVVTCCKECNVARNNNFTSDEMRQFIGPAIRAAKLARING